MQIGAELAEMLAGSWRQSSFRKRTLSSEDLRNHASLLASAGIAALAWFRIRRHTSELSPQVVNFYYREYLGSTMRAAVQEAELERLMEAFHAAGIRSILLKGWSVGRIYPESGLRPSGDIDLWIDPEQRGAAEVLLRDLALTQALDLEHDQLRRFEDRSFAEFYASCESVQLGSTQVKVLRREEQVRMLCLHFLKHGGWRPIWLCDIAIVLESQNGAFAWTRCLGTDARRARWIGCTVALARELLDARIPLGAPSNVTSSPPKWLMETVLRGWSDPRPPSTPALALSLRSLWHRPWKMEAAMRSRWRNSIQATIDCNGTFNGVPRWTYQARDAASRAMHVLPKVWAFGLPRFTLSRSEQLEMKSAGFLPRQLGIEESWQVSLKIHPAIVAQCDLALRTKAGVGGSDRHSEQNSCWLGILFSRRMTAEHGRAHALRLLHLALLFQARVRRKQDC